MSHTLLLKETFTISGLSVKLSTSQKGNYILIRNIWQRFNAELRTNRVKTGKTWKKYGVTFRKDGYYFYMAAIQLEQPCNNFETIEIPGGIFACFRHTGAMNLLKRTYSNIYKKLIPQTNLSIDKTRPVLHYEVYDNRFNWSKSDSIIDILIPLV